MNSSNPRDAYEPKIEIMENKEIKHTPAPWVVKHGHNVMGGGRVVANTGGYSSNINAEEVLLENNANTALIAAAPELLEALKLMVSANGGVAVLPTLEAKQQNAALEKAVAAITKATTIEQLTKTK
jgi:hypothetical protein